MTVLFVIIYEPLSASFGESSVTESAEKESPETQFELGVRYYQATVLLSQ